MIQFEIDDNFKKRYENFLSCDLFKNQNKISKTEYWKYHSKNIEINLKDNILKLKGESGLYYSERNLVRELKKIIKKILNFFYRNEVKYLEYKKAFNKQLKQSSYLKNKISFDHDSILVKNFNDIKEKYPFKKFEINDHVIKSYYIINLMNSYFDMSNVNVILEIGPGSCNLISLIKYHFNTKNFIIVDLPETLSISIPIINNLFPKSKIILPNENLKRIDNSVIKNFDFIFLTPNQISLINDQIVDLSINTDSFGEMNIEQVNLYIDLIQRASKNSSYFFNTNRVEKYPVGIEKNKNLNIQPTRFFDYKFYNNEIKFFELCDLTLEVQKYPVFNRLEKIIK